jgi:hypothetical protein
MKLVTPPTGDKRSVLLYGPPKTGKTTGATSAPGPVLLLNADLPNASWFAHSRRPDLVEVGYESFKETLIAIGKAVADGDKTFGGLTPPIATLVVDPINEMYRRLLEELSQRAVSPSLPTYQAVSVHLERFCRALCETPAFNVVFVCHDLPVKDEAVGEVERLPATGTTNPALGRRLMGMVDIVGYTAVMQQEEGGDYLYVAQLVNAKGRRGGDRFDTLGPFREMDLTEWFAAPMTPPAEFKLEHGTIKKGRDHRRDVMAEARKTEETPA